MRTAIAVVGAGFAGATVARCLAEAGQRVVVFEARAHVAGNCHTEEDAETGVLVHVHGPHIFHTADRAVWRFVNRFARFLPYRHQVRTVAGGRVYAMPLNLHLINQFFGLCLTPDQARAHLAGLAQPIAAPANFEEQALALMGRDLYEAFFRAYTEKQWGRAATALPASILHRLPVRFSYDDSYFAHPYQGMPHEGYTALVARMLDHPLIETRLAEGFCADQVRDWGHVFWSGPIDGFFGHRLGRLAYRTLAFRHVRVMGAEADLQGCAVMNYADADRPETRSTEHRHFSPWRPVRGSVLTHETPGDCGPGDLPYYPIRLADEQALLRRYEAEASALPGVSFIGRLGTYRYLDMDKTIAEAMQAARGFLAARSARQVPRPAEAG